MLIWHSQRWLKPLPLSHPAFGKMQILRLIWRVLNSIMRNAQALNEQSSDPFAVIEQLKAKKTENRQSNKSKVKKLLSSAVNIQAFSTWLTR